MSRVILLGGLLVALMAMGCSDESDDDGDAATGTVAATSAATTVPTDVATSAGAGGLDVMGSQACRDAALAAAEAFQSSSMGFMGVTEEQLGDLKDALDAAAVDAPDEVRADLAVFAEAWAEFAAAISASGWDPASGQAPPAAMMAAMQAFSSADVQAATERVGAWFEGNCQD